MTDSIDFNQLHDLTGLTEWELYELALEHEQIRTLYVSGPPGVGKTYLALKHGRIGKGFYSITLTDETSAAELRGHFLFKGGDAIWHDGPFVRAMREGKRLVINEITNASADVLALLFPILESWETAELTIPTGETLHPAEGFHVVASANEDMEQLPEALQDRFVAYIRVKEPHPDALANLSPELRAIAEAGAESLPPERRVSARGWNNLQMLAPGLGLETACRLCFGPDRGHLIHDAIVMATRGKKKKKS